MAGSRLPPSTYIPLFTRALDEEIGLYVEVNPEHTKRFSLALSEARQASLNPALAELMIFQPRENVYLIAKKSTELD